ncbi:MAG: MFS transporter [bacterium]|nr:MFS transporter [bacterium]
MTPHTDDLRLPMAVKAGYSLGDHAINVQLAATSLFYLFFLTEVAGLRPWLAGLVLLVGRMVDAFTDPAMGRLSDSTRWRAGRRRPYFLIGALPFGISFTLLWAALPLHGDIALFAAYSALYVVNTLSSTVLAVPYMALLPEMASSYQERTSANTIRQVGVVIALMLVAVAVRPVVEWFGGGAQGWSRVGLVMGIWIAVPWLVVYRVSFERPDFQRPAQGSLLQGFRDLARHRAYLWLGGLYIASRIALDIVGAVLIFWFTYWLRRPGDFSLALGLMLLTVVLAMPMWLWLSRFYDKRTLFVVGASWWVLIQLGLFLVGPDDPRWVVFALIGLAGIGYGVTDMMPWSMLGDVIDADEAHSGERREGMYAGLFTFLRKLGGATGVAAAGFALEVAGFVPGAEQDEAALWAIRILGTLVPVLFLVTASALALRYPLTRARHAELVNGLDKKRPD